MLKKLLLALMLFVSSSIYALTSEQVLKLEQMFYRYGYIAKIELAIDNDNLSYLIITNKESLLSELTNIMFSNIGIKAFIKFAEEQNYDFGEFDFIIFKTKDAEAIVSKIQIMSILEIDDKMKRLEAANLLAMELYDRQKGTKK